MHITWTEYAKNFIRQHADDMKDKEIAKILSENIGRKITLDAVRKQRQKMGIAKKCGRGICEVVKKYGQN